MGSYPTVPSPRPGALPAGWVVEATGDPPEVLATSPGGDRILLGTGQTYPRSFAAATAGADALLTWTNAGAASPFAIERSADGSSWAQIDVTAVKQPGACSHTDTNPGAGLWYYRAQASDASGFYTSAYSATASVTI